MAALSPSNTTRYFLTYVVDGGQHTMMVRTSADVTDNIASEDIMGFIDGMGNAVHSSTFVKFERSEEGSNVRHPATWSGASSWGSGSGGPADVPKFWSFTGKDETGHKSRVDLYGRFGDANSNYRLPAADDGHIAAALAALNPSEAVFLTINGDGAIWNSYANESFSQHWIGQARK